LDSYIWAQYVTENWHIPTLKNGKFTIGKPKFSCLL